MDDKELAKEIKYWANRNQLHQDDFDNLMIYELMEMLGDEEGGIL